MLPAFILSCRAFTLSTVHFLVYGSRNSHLSRWYGEEEGKDPPKEREEAMSISTTSECPQEEHTLTLDELKELKEIFTEFEDAGGLELQDFLLEVGPLFRRRTAISDEELEILFKRIDANANGSVDWDEISTFLLMTDEKEAITVATGAYSREYSAEPNVAPSLPLVEHNEPISFLFVHPSLPKYITASTSLIKYWGSDTLHHERTVCKSRAAIMYVGLTSWNDTIVVITLDRAVCFYSCDGGELVRAFCGQRKRWIRNAKGQKVPDDRRSFIYRPKFTIPLNTHEADELKFGDNAPELGKVETSVPVLSHFLRDVAIEVTVLEDLGYFNSGCDMWVHIGYPTAIDVLSQGDKDRMLIGLKSGFVQIYDLSTNVFGNPLAIPCLSTIQVHRDRICRIICCPKMDFVLTASWDGTVQVRNIDRLGEPGTKLGGGIIEPPEDFTQVKKDTIVPSSVDTGQRGHAHKILHMEWNEDLKLIATCARERDVLLWSPYLTKPLAKLDCKVHTVDLKFIRRDAQIVVLCEDRSMRIFDLRTYQCVQVLTASRQVPKSSLLCVSVDEKRECIVFSSTKLLTWPIVKRNECKQGYVGHRHHVVAVVWSKLFGQIISADEKSIIVWDQQTRFPQNRWEAPCTVCDICLDVHERRLLVGMQNGEVCVYNYINAYVLRECIPPAGTGEVTSIQFGEQLRPRHVYLIVSAHERGRCCIYTDDSTTCAPQRVLECGGCTLCASVMDRVLYVGIAGVVGSYNFEEVGSHTHNWELDPHVHNLRFLFNGPPAIPVVQKKDAGVDEVVDTAEKAACKMTECMVGISRLSPPVIVCGTGEGTIQMWCTEKLRKLLEVQVSVHADEGIFSLALNLNETILVCGDLEGYITILDIAGLSTLITPDAIVQTNRFRAHESLVSRIVFLDENSFLSSSFDCNVNFWDVDGNNFGKLDGRSTPASTLLGDKEKWCPHNESTVDSFDKVRAEFVLQQLKRSPNATMSEAQLREAFTEGEIAARCGFAGPFVFCDDPVDALLRALDVLLQKPARIKKHDESYVVVEERPQLRDVGQWATVTDTVSGTPLEKEPQDDGVGVWRAPRHPALLKLPYLVERSAASRQPKRIRLTKGKDRKAARALLTTSIVHEKEPELVSHTERLLDVPNLADSSPQEMNFAKKFLWDTYFSCAQDPVAQLQRCVRHQRVYDDPCAIHHLRVAARTKEGLTESHAAAQRNHAHN